MKEDQPKPEEVPVFVIGAGIAGLTVAHELAVRGLKVCVVEAGERIGGKAASQRATPMDEKGHDRAWTVLGEHGFRVFPAYYRHVIDTMRRIPSLDSPADPQNLDPIDWSNYCDPGEVVLNGRPIPGRTVADGLTPTPESAVALGDGKLPHPHRPAGGTLSIARALSNILAASHAMNVPVADILRLMYSTIKYMTSCDERREREYEGQTWWEFVRGDDFGTKGRHLIDAIPRTLVAMSARQGSARTNGNATIQHLMEEQQAADRANRLLPGPTSVAWFGPWKRLLRSLGVFFVPNTKITRLRTDAQGRVVWFDWQATESSCRVREYERRPEIFDEPPPRARFVLAVPLQVAQELVREPHGGPIQDPSGSLARLCRIDPIASTGSMAGIQFFLPLDVRIFFGHVYCPETDWKLSIVSQAQFWGDDFVRRYGAGQYRGVLSVIIGEEKLDGWRLDAAEQNRIFADEDGPVDLKRRLKAAFAARVWKQIRGALDAPGHVSVPETVQDYWIDDALDFDCDDRQFVKITNRSRHTIHPPGMRALRPDPETVYGHGTFYLTGDFTLTATDLATMESASEAGRRTACAVLDDIGVVSRTSTTIGNKPPLGLTRLKAEPYLGETPELWRLREPADLDDVKALDASLCAKGTPHLFAVLGFDHLMAHAGADPVKVGAVLKSALESLAMYGQAAVGAKLFDLMTPR